MKTKVTSLNLDLSSELEMEELGKSFERLYYYWYTEGEEVHIPKYIKLEEVLRIMAGNVYDLRKRNK